MRAVIQRINGAQITINGGETREVKEGLVVFVCAMEGDTDAQADFLVQKVCGLRVFKDENDKMNRSLEDIKGDMLIVSNITLSADMKHGRRPDFSRSASPSEALRLYNYFVEQVKKSIRLIRKLSIITNLLILTDVYSTRIACILTR